MVEKMLWRAVDGIIMWEVLSYLFVITLKAAFWWENAYIYLTEDVYYY